MKMRWIAWLAAACSIAPLAAQAQDAGSWLVRGHALYLDSANKNSDAVDLSVNNKTFPEFDVSYFYAPNFAVELVLTYPQKHDVKLGGNKIGTVKHLPPTLSAQYHFTGLPVKPYVGAGLNYTMFSGVDLPAGLSIKKSSVGLAVGAGVDVPLSGNWMFNFDVKKVQIKTDVKNNGSKIDTFKIDPWLIGVGAGYKF